MLFAIGIFLGASALAFGVLLALGAIEKKQLDMPHPQK